MICLTLQLNLIYTNRASLILDTFFQLYFPHHPQVLSPNAFHFTQHNRVLSENKQLLELHADGDFSNRRTQSNF